MPHRLFYLSFLFLLVSTVHSHAQGGKDSISKSDSETYFEYQTQKGRWWVGADFGVGLGFRSESLNIVNTTTLIDASFTPKVGYFVLPKLLVGTNMNISSSLTVVEGQDQFELRNTTLGLFGRYYLKGGLFGEASYGLGWGYELRPIVGTNTLERYEFDSNGYALGVGISNYWLERVSFEVLLRYAAVKGHYKGTDASDLEFSGLTIKAGIGYSIGR